MEQILKTRIQMGACLIGDAIAVGLEIQHAAQRLRVKVQTCNTRMPRVSTQSARRLGSQNVALWQFRDLGVQHTPGGFPAKVALALTASPLPELAVEGDTAALLQA